MDEHKSVILFDGVCNLCNRSVQFIIKRDPKAYFSFAPLQSVYGQNVLEKAKLDKHDFDSFVLIENQEIYTKSTAALMVTKRLSYAWPLLYYLCIWIPRLIRDGIYLFISRNRYRWFGKQEKCMIPTPAIQNRFIDS